MRNAGRCHRLAFLPQPALFAVIYAQSDANTRGEHTMKIKKLEPVTPASASFFPCLPLPLWGGHHFERWLKTLFRSWAVR